MKDIKMKKIQTILVSDFQQNARVLWDEETKECVVFDPGDLGIKITSFLNDNDLILSSLVLTHSHIDHIMGVNKVLDYSNRSSEFKYYGHENEKMMREMLPQISDLYGFSPLLEAIPEPTHYISGDETIELIGMTAEVRFVPGHSPGHLVFFISDYLGTIDSPFSKMSSVNGPVVIAGDTLFKGSIGRTDLPGSNHNDLMNALQTQLLTLPDETRVLSGHGPDTTIGIERKTNPFLR